MKIEINKEKLNLDIYTIIRRCGYARIFDNRSGQESYVRRLGARDNYPRFHLYIEETEKYVILNLHLDQKRAIYAGAKAHNADYDGEVVETETKRLKSEISKLNKKINEPEKKVKKKGVFKKIFGK